MTDTTTLGTCPACQCRPSSDWESAYAHAYDWAYIHELMSLDDAERFANWFATHYKDDYDNAPSYRFALTVWEAPNTRTLPSGDTVRAYVAGEWS